MANAAPTTSNSTHNTNEDTGYVLSASDFNFVDIDGGDTLQAVQITVLPTIGTLRLKGVNVAIDQVVSIADINAGYLVFTPAANASGSNYSTFDFKVSDGTLWSASAASFGFNVNAVNDAPTFGMGTGTLTTAIGSGYDQANSVIVQSDGKILLGGYSQNGSTFNFSLARYTTNGSLDTTFDTDGKLTTAIGSSNDRATSVTLQADGKILLAGNSYKVGDNDFTLVRYNTNGSLDTTFDTDGKVTTTTGNDTAFANSVTVQADGKILLGGYRPIGNGKFGFSLMRYNTDGNLDTTFDTDGKLTTAIDSNSTNRATSVTVQTDGKILLGGYSGYIGNGSDDDFALARYNSDGSLDTTFDTDGKLTTAIGSSLDQASSVTLQADGKILLGGYSWNGSNTDFALVRYNTNGSLDTTFDTDGKLTTAIGSSSTDRANSVTVQADGKILLGGYTRNGSKDDFVLVRYNTNGSLDTTFDTDGKLTTTIGSSLDQANSVTVQADGKILLGGFSIIGGNYDFALVRYNSDGSLDTTFNPSNTLDATPTYTANGSAVVIDSNVQITDQELSAANNYAGSTLTLARNGGANAQDVFAGSGSLSLSAGNAVVSSTTIGSYTNNAGSLSLNFNSNATQTLVNSALQQITYANSNPAASGNAQINWTFNDGSGAGNAAVSGSTTVTLIPAPNSAPTLNNAGSPSFPAVNEGATNPAGITVSALVVDGSIADLDGAVEAIAITALNTSLGAWQYSTNNGGTWLTIRAELINSSSNELALHLGSTDKIRLLPFGDLNGNLSDAITFRAWDQSNSGSVANGTYAVIAGTGGTTAYSTVADTATITVTAVNAAPSFAPNTGGTGKLVTDIGSGSDDRGYSVTVQADGKLVVAGFSNSGGTYNFAVVRYNADGSLDTSFNAAGTPGKLVTDLGGDVSEQGRSVTVQADGKLVVAGYTTTSGGSRNFAVARYNADGTLDTSFNAAGTPGKLVTDIGSASFDECRSVTVQADGKLVVAGTSDSGGSENFAVVRYNANGTLDTSFNATGTPGKLVTDIGSSSIDLGQSVTVQADGKLVVVGASNSGGTYNFAVVRYNADGTLDISFNAAGTPGKLVTDIGSGLNGYGQSVTVQADGKLVVAGIADKNDVTNFAVVRYNADGTLDTSFNAAGTPGKLITDIGSSSIDQGNSVTVQADGKLVVAGLTNSGGSYNFAVVRYNADGTLDTSFNAAGTPGKLVTDIGSGSLDRGQSVTVQADGKLVVAGLTDNSSGSYDFAVVRYNADGTLDTSFGATAGSNTLDATPTYTGNSSAVVLDSNVQIIDQELSAANNYAGSTLTLARNGGANAQDVFAGSGTLSLSGGNVIVSSTIIGTYTNSAGSFSLNFNSNATQALVNSALQQITYANTNNASGSAEIIWRFNDGSGAGNAIVQGSTVVTLISTNVVPTVDGSQAGQAVTSAQRIQPFKTISVTDPDVGALETATITLDNPLKGSFTANSMALAGFYTNDSGVSYVHDVASPAAMQAAIRALVFEPNPSRLALNTSETTTFTIAVQDQHGGTAINSTTTVITSSVNTAPTNILLSDAFVAQSEGANATVGLLSATDNNVGDIHTFALTAANAGNDNAKFSIVGNSLKVIDPRSMTEKDYDVMVQATDANGLSFTKKLTISLDDDMAPFISSIETLRSPRPTVTTGSYIVKFNENVTGVTLDDFFLSSGSGTTAHLSSITALSGNAYRVYIDQIVGTGSLNLNLKTSGTGIADLFGNSLPGSLPPGPPATPIALASNDMLVGIHLQQDVFM